MNRILTTTTAAIFILLVSCQRPVDEVYEPVPPVVEPPGVTADSTLLSHIWLLDPAVAVGSDTLSAYTFRYDESKRPLEQVIEDRTQDGAVEYYTRFNYFYTGAATLPYLVTMLSTSIVEPQFDGLDSMFLSYENGLVSKDSTIHYALGSPVYLYQDINTNTNVGDSLYNHIVTIRREDDGQETIQRDQVFPVKIIRENGNVLEFTCPQGPEHPYNVHRYNDHPNPQYPFYIPFPFEYNIWEWGDVAYKNLPTYSGSGHERLSADPNKWDFEEFSYEYRADGYPLLMKVTDSWQDNYNVRYAYY